MLAAVTLSHFLPGALLFALGGLSALAAAGDPGNPIPDAIRPHGDRADRAWKRYRNSNLNYCVSYPSRWSKGDAFDGGGLFVEAGVRRYSKPTGEIDVGPMNIPSPADARMKEASLASDNLDQDLREHLDGLRKFVHAERMEVMEQHPLELRGLPALFVKNKYYDPLERSNWMQEVVFVKRKSEVYRLELQCPPDQIKRFEPVFAYLVNTLDFDCGK